MPRSFVPYPALSQVLYSESISRDRDARHQQGGPSYHHSKCRSPSGLGSHTVIDWGKCRDILQRSHAHIHKDLEWDCHHVQQSETSSWPACYYCGAWDLCKEYTSVPCRAHRSVTHSLVLIVLISLSLHWHMNEKSSQLVNSHAVRATIEAISKFTLLTLNFISQKYV